MSNQHESVLNVFAVPGGSGPALAATDAQQGLKVRCCRAATDQRLHWQVTSHACSAISESLSVAPSQAVVDSLRHSRRVKLLQSWFARPLRPPAAWASEAHLETHTCSQTPHFMSYSMDMDMTRILQYQVYLLAKCHIHVITMS